MSEVRHATFTVERVYASTPARVFKAWADPAAKRRWLGCHDDWEMTLDMDFRVGGKERSRSGPPGGEAHIFDGTYHDIVPHQRIVYAYDMYIDEQKISISLVTVELKAEGRGTRLTFTEQGVYFDGCDIAEREEGTSVGMDRLGEALRLQAV